MSQTLGSEWTYPSTWISIFRAASVLSSDLVQPFDQTDREQYVHGSHTPSCQPTERRRSESGSLQGPSGLVCDLGKPSTSSLTLFSQNNSFLPFALALTLQHLGTGCPKQIVGREKGSHLWVAYVRTIAGRFGSQRCLCQRILARGMEKRVGR